MIDIQIKPIFIVTNCPDMVIGFLGIQTDLLISMVQRHRSGIFFVIIFLLIFPQTQRKIRITLLCFDQRFGKDLTVDSILQLQKKPDSVVQIQTKASIYIHYIAKCYRNFHFFPPLCFYLHFKFIAELFIFHFVPAHFRNS